MGVSQLDEWSEKKQQRVTVGEGGGFLYNIQLQSKVDSSPDGGFVLLVKTYFTQQIYVRSMWVCNSVRHTPKGFEIISAHSHQEWKPLLNHYLCKVKVCFYQREWNGIKHG